MAEANGAVKDSEAVSIKLSVKDEKDVSTESSVKDEKAMSTEPSVKDEKAMSTEPSVKDEKTPEEVESKSSVTVTDEEKKANGEQTKDLTTLERQIIRQVEYYFGDINLPRDKFLQEQIKLDNGWIPLEIMLKFKRLAGLSTDVAVIEAALEKSTSGLMEISEDKKKIRRNPNKTLPLQNEERRKELQERTIYSKGFPQDVTLDTLLEFFQPYGPIDSVQMRAYIDKKKNTHHFKGSVFTVFTSKDKAEEFLKLENVKFGDTDLIRLWQCDYLAKKREEREERNKQKRTRQKDEDGDEEDDEEPKNKKSFPKGTVLHLKGNFNDIEREKIKSRIEELGGNVGYVSYNPGDEECWIRLNEEGDATKLAEGLEDSKLELAGEQLEARVLGGEEETEFLEKAMTDKMRRRQKSNQRGKRGGRGGRGGRGRGGFQNRKRKSEDAGGDNRPAKVSAKE